MDKKKLLRRTAWTLAGLVLLMAAGAAAIRPLSDRKAQRVVRVDAAAVAYRSDAGSVEQGRYLYQSRGCAECHGADGGGRVFIDEPNGLRVRGANITRGAGSAVAAYTERDWVRAIRHGVKPDGKPLLIMPSEDFNRLTDQDLAAVVAYVRALPPADRPPAELKLPLVVHALYAMGVVQDAAEKIDHSLPPSKPVAVAVSAEHGYYVSRACIGCHGPGLAGGKIPGTPPHWPPAANLTPGEGSVLGRYVSAEAFRELVLTGRRPDGTNADKSMPRHRMSEVDLDALYTYLKTAPARPAGSR